MAAEAAPNATAQVPADIYGPAMPGLAAGLVARPRLFALLDGGASRFVTLLSAPAGSGKTMLVSSWLRSSPLSRAVAWVTVERGESDATHFWAIVMDALRASGAVAPDDPLATLVPAPLGTQDEFMQHLREGLARLLRPVLLVLDDLHELRSEDALRTSSTCSRPRRHS